MGTDAWRNWRAFSAGQAEIENFDTEFQSDVQLFGGPMTFGPYELSTVIRDAGPVGPAVMFFAGVHADLMPEVVVGGQLAKADSSAYHGGTMSDEIAALISLELGVRLRVAGTRRLSGIHDPKQPRPPIYIEVPRLARPGAPGRELIPRATSRAANLDKLRRLHSLPTISEEKQVELIRAARSFASGVWWANEDPNLAWLQLVTAVEIAANCRQLTKNDPVDMLREHWPELWAVVEREDVATRELIAQKVAVQTRATRKFIDFVVQCAPPPPDQRPNFSQLDWSKMRKHAATVYDHRSKALHAGKPFPMPMLEEPRRDGMGTYQEIPFGLNAGGLGGIWSSAEMPMLLSTFEYIARGAILRWWDELIEDGKLPAA